MLRGRTPSLSPALAALALAALVIGPLKDFPLDDDWVPYLTVVHLVKEGRLMIMDYAAMTTVWHAAWGGLFAAVLGLGHGALRLSTLALSAASLQLFRGLAEPPRGRAAWALSPEWLLLANPLFFALSFTFMTDVPYLAWSLLSLALYREALRRDETGWWLAASAAASLAFLVRQIGLAIPAGVLLHLWLGGRLDRRRLLLVAALPLAAWAAHGIWFARTHGGVTFYGDLLRRATRHHLSRPLVFAAKAYLRLSGALIYFGLFTLPWSAALSARRLKLPRPLPAAALLAAFVPLLAAKRFPFFFGVIDERGIGFTSLADRALKPAGLLGEPWFHALLVAAGILSCLAWLARGRELARAAREEDARLLAVPCLLPLLAALASPKFFDRYLLPALPWVLLVGWRAAREELSGRAPTLAATGLSAALLLWPLAGTCDWLNWNEARWSAARAAVASGIPPEYVQAGSEWLGVHLFESRMAELRAKKPLREIGEWEWLEGRVFAAGVTFSAEPLPGHRNVATREYWTPLSREPGRVYAHALDRASSAR